MEKKDAAAKTQSFSRERTLYPVNASLKSNVGCVSESDDTQPTQQEQKLISVYNKTSFTCGP